MSPSRRLAILGFILSLVTAIGATVSINHVLKLAEPYTGAAIDSEDGNVLDAFGREALVHYAAAAGWINLAGTLLGVAALIIAVRTRKSGWVWITTLVLALAAPVACFIPSVWIFAAWSASS